MAKTRSASKSLSKTDFEMDKPQEPIMLNKDNSDSESDEDEHELGIDLDNATNDEKLNFLCRQLGQITKLQNDVKRLRKEINQKNIKINSLENRVDELEQYSRREDLVISGIELKNRSYARVTRTGQNDDKNEGGPIEEQESVETQVINEFAKRDVLLKSEDISACHTLGKKEPGKTNPIVIRFVSRKTKIDILRNSKKLKDPQNESWPKIYVNEHLTKLNASIARKARFLRKQQKIVSTWTRNCTVFIKYNIDIEHTRIMAVKSIDDLNKFS